MKWALFSTAILIAASVSISQAGDAGNHQHKQHSMDAMESSGSQMSHQRLQHSMTAGENNDSHMNHAAISADNADPHADHRAMMAQKTDTVRSTHDYQVPALMMKNSHGKKIDVQALLNQDKPVMVNFIFTTCPTICPILSSTFSIVNQQLGSNTDLNMISISIDPEQDTPTELLKYANKFNANDNWAFITGQIEQSIAIQKAFDIYRGSKMSHVPATFFRASSDTPWTRLDGFASSEELIAEYHKMVL